MVNMPLTSVYVHTSMIFGACNSGIVLAEVYVTLHHEMSCNVPYGPFHVFIFSESKLYATYNGKTHFQIRGLVAELYVFEYGGTTFSTSEKTCFKC